MGNNRFDNLFFNLQEKASQLTLDIPDAIERSIRTGIVSASAAKEKNSDITPEKIYKDVYHNFISQGYLPTFAHEKANSAVAGFNPPK